MKKAFLYPIIASISLFVTLITNTSMVWAGEMPGLVRVRSVETTQQRGWIIQVTGAGQINKFSLGMDDGSGRQSLVVATVATSRSKHLVMMLDESGSMRQYQRQFKALASAVVVSVAAADVVVSVVAFGRDKRSLCDACKPKVAMQSIESWQMRGSSQTCLTRNLMEVAAADQYLAHLATGSDLQVIALTDGIEDCETRTSQRSLLDTLRDIHTAPVHLAIVSRTTGDLSSLLLLSKNTGGSMHRIKNLRRRSDVENIAKELVSAVTSRSSFFLKTPASLSKRDVVVGIHSTESVVYIRSQAPWVQEAKRPQQPQQPAPAPSPTSWIDWLQAKIKWLGSVVGLVVFLLGVGYTRRRRRMVLMVEEMESDQPSERISAEEWFQEEGPASEEPLSPEYSPESEVTEMRRAAEADLPITTKIPDIAEPSSSSIAKPFGSNVPPRRSHANDDTFAKPDPDAMVELRWRLCSDDRKIDLELPEGQEFLVGRAEGCDLSLDDRAVSRQHVTLEAMGPQLTLHPLSKTNITRAFLPGQAPMRISQPTTLQTGGVLEIGDTRLRFEKRIR